MGRVVVSQGGSAGGVEVVRTRRSSGIVSVERLSFTEQEATDLEKGLARLRGSWKRDGSAARSE